MRVLGFGLNPKSGPKLSASSRFDNLEFIQQHHRQSEKSNVNQIEAI
jgi:hypothetical protein